jgi:hypothetical protein
VTKHKTSDTEAERDRPANESGAPQIEVTPEMIEAGWGALLSFESRDFPDRAMVMDVFEAMLLAAPVGWPVSCGNDR